jgi:hypothetical protein
LGLTPKNAGCQITRSATLPTSTDPMCASAPTEIAGLIVSFAMYLLTRSLSAAAVVSSGSRPVRSFITAASCQQLAMFSATRPMPWVSLPKIEIAPMSCR